MVKQSVSRAARLKRVFTLGIICLFSISIVVFAVQQGGKTSKKHAKEEKIAKTKGLKKATFGGGCFWCTEAVFQELKGVKAVFSGYSGGKIKNPTYKQIGTGTTGHAEVVQIFYDPKLTTYKELLEVFWKTHDPTTLNRQGNDIGPQYRSVVFYHDATQKKLAVQYKKKLDKAGVFKKPIVTEISPAKTFYLAEKYHQNFFELNPQQPYCRAVIVPKMEKFRKVFKDKLQSGK